MSVKVTNLIHTDLPSQLLLAQLFDSLPDIVLWVRAVYDQYDGVTNKREESTQNQVDDFVIEYANPKARQTLTGVYQLTSGTSIRYGNRHFPSFAEQTFRHLCQVFETGKTIEFDYYDNTRGQWFLVTRSKAGDGVLSISRCLPDSKEINLENEYQRTLLDGIPNTSTDPMITQEVIQADFSDLPPILRRPEQAIVESVANLQAIIDVAQTGIFMISPVFDEQGEQIDFRFKLVNRTLAELVGQTPDRVQGTLFSDWFTSYRDTPVFAQYKQVLETGEEKYLETHYTVDGFDEWFDVKAVKFNDDVLITFTNYTELKRAQQRLEQTAIEAERQAELLNSVLDSSNSGVIAFKAIRNEAKQIVDFHFLVANQTATVMLSKKMEEMVGEKLLTIFPGNVESGLFALYTKTTETGEPGRTQVYYNHDGLDFWLDISSHKLEDGFVVTFTDISEAKRAALLIEQSAAELRTVIDSAQVAIFLITPVFDKTGALIDFRFRTANQMIARYVGQEPDALTGELVSRWFPEYRTNGLFHRYGTIFETGRTQHFNFHVKIDTIDSWENYTVVKVGNDILVTFSDYTELKKLQQQLENSVIDLQRSNKNLEQFAYIASHDLQEPLRKIQAFGDIVQSQFAPVIGEDGADMIARMQSAAARMQILIKDVLAYSRIANKRENVGPVDLNRLVADVLNDIETAITDKKAVVRVESLPTVRGDAAQLRQLVQNLVSNALKFTKVDKTAGPPAITITSRRMDGRDLAGVSLPNKDDDRQFNLIEVSDNGIGFDPHQAERIFQVFQRLHGRSEYQGTGIGLAIVQKVVDNHHGYILAEGRPGQGATFRVLLPV